MEKQDNDNNIENYLGWNLRNLRMIKGLSLKAVSEKSNVSVSYLNRLENFKRIKPSLQILKQLASVFDVNVIDLLRISSQNNESKIRDISEVLLESNYTVNGKEVSEEVRLLLSGIIEQVLGKEWQHGRNSNVLYKDLKRKIKYLNNLF
jgi:transcriptional regulator with XRE-family HTH domain